MELNNFTIIILCDPNRQHLQQMDTLKSSISFGSWPQP